jgi:hypothetical protein
MAHDETIGKWAETPPQEPNVEDYMRMAREGTLPDGFDQWELADEDGTTVAHVVARYGRLPVGFDGWELADNNGTTVAHVAAMVGNLPGGFDRWDLADKNGRTVADAVRLRWSKRRGEPR